MELIACCKVEKDLNDAYVVDFETDVLIPAGRIRRIERAEPLGGFILTADPDGEEYFVLGGSYYALDDALVVIDGVVPEDEYMPEDPPED